MVNGLQREKKGRKSNRGGRATHEQRPHSSPERAQLVPCGIDSDAQRLPLLPNLLPLCASDTYPTGCSKSQLSGPRRLPQDAMLSTSSNSRSDCSDEDFAIPGMEHLFCPWLWKANMGGMQLPCVPPLDRMRAADTEDSLPAAATPWHRVLDLLAIAYSHGTHSNPSGCRTKLVECFLHLLPPFDKGCQLIRDYREALRHILDASYAMSVFGDLEEPGTDSYLKAFIHSIKPFSLLSATQRAALLAIKASMAHSIMGESEMALRTSVSLSPQEGAWQTMLGEVVGSLFSQEQTEGEGLLRLREGFRLRKNPHSMMALVDGLARAKTEAPRREAEALLTEALALYPNHVHVLMEAAKTLPGLRGKTPESYVEARGLVQRARKLTGDRSFYYLELGRLCELEGRRQDARGHYKRACRLNPMSAPYLQAIHGLEPDPSICVCNSPQVFAGEALEKLKNNQCKTQ